MSGESYTDLLGYLGAVQFEMHKVEAKRSFVASIVNCMDQEKVGLEEGIRRAEMFARSVADAEPLPADEEHLRPALQKMMADVFIEAAEYLRRHIDGCRELVRLADQT